MRRWRLVLFLLLFAVGARSAAAAPGTGPKTFQLANGLQVALAPDSFATTVDVALWFPAGSRHEATRFTGLTHLMDGLLFAGTPGHPSGDQRRLIQREGGAVNAFSTPDYACADDNVPPAALDLALRLEADRMQHLEITDRTLAAVKGALAQEHATSQGASPLGQAMRRLYGVAFAGHTYRFPVQGNSEDLARLTLPVVQAWWRDHYGPAGTWLTVTGAFDPATAEAMVRRAFGPVPKRGTHPAEPPAPARQIVEHRGSGTIAAQVPLLLVGYRTAADRTTDAAALEALDHLLSSGTRTPLQRALISDTTGCLALVGGLYLRREAGLYHLVAAIRPDADSASAQQEVLDAFQRLATSPVSDADLAATVKQIELQSMLARQSSLGAGLVLGAEVATGAAFSSEDERLERTRALTPASVRDVAERTFTSGHRTVIWMRPAPAAPPPAPQKSSGAKSTAPKSSAPKRTAPKAAPPKGAAPASKGGP